MEVETDTALPEAADVLVVGAGNAALCAALAAAEGGASVLVVECAPKEERGGNSSFTAGAMRVAYKGSEDILKLVPDLSPSDLENTDFGSYTEDEFFDDMARLTEYRANPDLVELLVQRSFDTLDWMRSKGVRFVPIYGRQAFKIDGKFKFWGGLTLEANGGGPGLVSFLIDACNKADVTIAYETRAVELITHGGSVIGVTVQREGVSHQVRAKAVVLASGGFQANAEWRTRYLGPGWDLAKVRGTRFNTGGGLDMALRIGASPAGQWSGCHAVQWDMNAPEFGDLAVGDGFQKHSYPFGILVNNDGKRFLDEGADFRNYTYAKYGREMLKQPGQMAWQVFDAKIELRDEYRIPQVSKVSANSLEELAKALDGMNVADFLKTINEYNAAVDTSVPFNPNVLDGRRTVGLDIDKTNWANTIDTPPFEAYMVGCGITFTFGGLRINTGAEVLNHDASPIPGLFACGEIVGGLFYFNYPGGAGLTAGSVFGRIAGQNAAQFSSGN
jgi:tricarballylate dehydrogenase